MFMKRSDEPIHRGAGDPFRYVAAEYYDGADKLPEVAAHVSKSTQ
jgi:hypothetical protein